MSKRFGFKLSDALAWPCPVRTGCRRGCELLLMFVAIYFLAAAAPPVQASTYYVSPNGSDGNSGTSAASPWRTTAKVNSTTFQPGDQIFFQRGGEWRESLKASSSGAVGNPITYADYGSGAKPNFWGSVVLNNADFTSSGNSVYSYNIATPVNAVLVNHLFLFDSLGQSTEAVPKSYAWSGGVLKVNTSGSDPRTDGRVYTACIREDVIYSNYQNHLVFRNLVTDESAKFDGGYGVRIMNSTDVLIEGCEAWRAGKHNFGCINSTRVIYRNCYAAYAMPRLGHGGNSAFVSYGDNSTGLANQSLEYHGCVSEHAEDSWDGQTYYIFITHGSNIGSILLKNLVSRGGGWIVDNSQNNATIKIQGGLLENDRLELRGRNILVDGLRITGPRGTVDMIADDSILQNLVISGTNLGFDWYQTAVLSRGQRNTIRFCTIVMAPDAPDFNTCIALAAPGTRFKYYGNVLIATRLTMRLWAGAPDPANIADARYNLFKRGATFAAAEAYDLGGWKALGFDAGSIEAPAPLFVNPPAGDYSLEAASAGIDAALLSSSLTTEVPCDYRRLPRLRGAAFDMGAYEAAAGNATNQPTGCSDEGTSGARSPGLVWRHQTNGAIGKWSMSGMSLVESVFFNPGVVSDIDWKIVGSGDFNDDGKLDLVWQHETNGLIGVWFMNEATLIRSVYFNPGREGDPNWKIVAVADFNVDRKPDLAWQHGGNGSAGVWLMNGTDRVGVSMFNPNQVTDTNWKIVGAGDFNGDGSTDLVWQHKVNRLIGVWLMNGTTLIQASFFSPSQVGDAAWNIVGVNDFNGDGKPDLVWHNEANGYIGAWFMNGTALIQAPFFTPSQVSDTDWKIVATQ